MNVVYVERFWHIAGSAEVVMLPLTSKNII